MKFLLILFLMAVIGSWLLKRLAPYMLLWFFKKVQQKAQNGAFGPSGSFNQKQREQAYPPGHIDIDHKQANPAGDKNRHTSGQAGEYIDFEEVKE